jgi:hypothetical protein
MARMRARISSSSGKNKSSTPDPCPATPRPFGGPAPETEEARRERFHAARVASVRASFERGRRCLLARALDPADQVDIDDMLERLAYEAGCNAHWVD